jgi:SNF family Na+-dependent transporter
LGSFQAVLLMPLPHLWAVLFFFMMYVLGLGSQIAGIEAITTAVIDQWPHLRNTHWKVSGREMHSPSQSTVHLLIIFFLENHQNLPKIAKNTPFSKNVKKTL